MENWFGINMRPAQILWYRGTLIRQQISRDDFPPQMCCFTSTPDIDEFMPLHEGKLPLPSTSNLFYGFLDLRCYCCSVKMAIPLTKGLSNSNLICSFATLTFEGFPSVAGTLDVSDSTAPPLLQLYNSTINTEGE